MNELQKIESFRKDLAIVETIEEVKLHETTASAMATFAKANKISFDKQNELGRFRIEIECKKGEILNKEFPYGGDKIARFRYGTLQKGGILNKEFPYGGKNKYNSDEVYTMETSSITPRESSRARAILECEKLPEYMDFIEQAGNVITPNGVDEIIKKDRISRK
jgi:hypothetical protein